MSSIQMIYHRELCKQAVEGLEGIVVTVKSETEAIERTMEECLEKLGAESGENMVFEIEKSGRSVTLFDKNVGKVSYENLLAICCAGEAEKGHDISLPFDAPEFLDEIAAAYGVKVYRYLDCSGNDNDDDAHRITLKQIWVRDALFLVVKILNQMKEKECGIAELLNLFPDVYVEKRTVKIQIKPSELAKAFSNENSSFSYEREGFSLRKNDGVARVIPSRMGDSIRIISESNREETAREFSRIEDTIRKVIPEKELDTILDNLNRIRDLATQAANGVYDDTALDAMKSEVDARMAEIDRISQASNFNGLQLLDGTTTDMRLQVGANADADANSIEVTGVFE